MYAYVWSQLLTWSTSNSITKCRTDGDLQIETHPIMYDLHFSLPFPAKNSHSSRTPQQALGNGTLAFTGTDRNCGLFQDYRSLQRPKRSERNSYVELNIRKYVLMSIFHDHQ
jgi:hypothetical protein